MTVHTDSLYLLNPFSLGWFPRWIKQGWKVANADLWQALLIAAEPHSLAWEKVPAHTRVPLNEECDELAGLARRAAIAMQGDGS